MWALLKRQRQHIERELMSVAEDRYGDGTDAFHEFVLWMSDLTDRELVMVACEFAPDIHGMELDYFEDAWPGYVPYREEAGYPRRQVSPGGYQKRKVRDLPK